MMQFRANQETPPQADKFDLITLPQLKNAESQPTPLRCRCFEPFLHYRNKALAAQRTGACPWKSPVRRFRAR
jgi:hypothetical protein